MVMMMLMMQGRVVPTEDSLTAEWWETRARLSAGGLLGAGCQVGEDEDGEEDQDDEEEEDDDKDDDDQIKRTMMVLLGAGCQVGKDEDEDDQEDDDGAPWGRKPG